MTDHTTPAVKITPPAPTADAVREAVERLSLVATGEVAPSHHIRSADIRTILTELTEAQELSTYWETRYNDARQYALDWELKHDIVQGEVGQLKEALDQHCGEIDTLRAENDAQAERIAELEAELAQVREWARGGGCWTCRNAGKCEHEGDDGGVLDGGVCNHWTPAWVK